MVDAVEIAIRELTADELEIVSGAGGDGACNQKGSCSPMLSIMGDAAAIMAGLPFGVSLPVPQSPWNTSISTFL